MVTLDPGGGDNIIFWSEFNIQEDWSQMSQIEIVVEARQGGGADPDGPAQLAVWNYENSRWDILDTLEVGNTGADGTYSGFINNNFDDYLDPTTNELTFILMNNDTSETLEIDYVKVDVDTFGTPTEVDVITDFELGANGDVIDLDELLPGLVNNGTATEDLTEYLSFSFSGGNTTIHVDHDGNVGDSGFDPTLNIVLQGVDLSQGGTVDDPEQILSDMIANGNLTL